MDHLYLPFAETRCGEDGASHETFGLHCWELQDGLLTLRHSIRDLSTDRRLVNALARRCTAEQLEPVHLLDVVLDTLP